MMSLNWHDLTTDTKGDRVWWCSCVECLGVALLLAVVACLIGWATAATVEVPGDIVGFPRYLLIWLVLDLFVLTLMALSADGGDPEDNRR
jgi:hypothetical protein